MLKNYPRSLCMEHATSTHMSTLQSNATSEFHIVLLTIFQKIWDCYIACCQTTRGGNAMKPVSYRGIKCIFCISSLGSHLVIFAGLANKIAWHFRPWKTEGTLLKILYFNKWSPFHRSKAKVHLETVTSERSLYHSACNIRSRQCLHVFQPSSSSSCHNITASIWHSK